MSRFKFSAFSTPTAPRKQDMKDLYEEPNELISFMPQPSTPMMLMSSASRRQTHKSVDARATRLLLDASPPHDYDEHTDEQDGYREHFDINKTPATPPLTPFTPTTDTSFSSSSSAFSLTVITNVFVHMRSTSRLAAALFALFVGALMMLLLVAFFGIAGVKAGVYHSLQAIWSKRVFVSDTIEAVIECLGWVLGRVLGRFGKGFEAGYRV